MAVTIGANFDGRCACCDQPYKHGTQITHSNDRGGWVIASHLKEPVICQSCFMAKPETGICPTCEE